jgi:hypothetical protein
MARDERRRQAEAAARGAEAARRARERQTENRRPATTDRKAQASAQRTARRAAEQAEVRVQELEKVVASRGALLADPALYATPDGTIRAGALAKELDFAKAELETAYAAWEAATAEAERLGA